MNDPPLIWDADMVRIATGEGTMYRTPSSSWRRRIGLRLLVLDEDLGSRRMMAFLIAMRGHRCATVDSAEGAFASIEEFRPDAIIYDWNRRGGELRGFGHDVKSRYGYVRGLVVTSCIDEPRGFQVEEGVDGYFTKPLAMGDVITRVELIVRSRRE